MFRHKPDHKTLLEWCLSHWNHCNIYENWQTRGNAVQKETVPTARAEAIGVDEFVLHDGPPYANGDIHLGHAVNKTLKDCINRFMAMKGYRVNFILGWDCNGLPIEAKVESDFAGKGLKMHQVDVSDFRQACAAFANKWVDIQRNSFQRMGIVADTRYYTTIQPENQIEIIKLIHRFADKNLIIRDLKPVMWSCQEGTALAEAEIEYIMKDSTTIDVAFPIVYSSIEELKTDSFIPIWTTTPWTIPANRAVAYHNETTYLIVKEIVKEQEQPRTFVIAKELLSSFIERTGLTFITLREIKGSELSGTICLHPLYHSGLEFRSPLYHSDHVTTSQGTGFVHIAPDHGEDDFKLAKRENISCCNYLTDTGHFIQDLPEFLAGRFYADTEAGIISLLNEAHAILSVSEINHQYPHSWRSRKPLIQRATNQWFVDIKNSENNLQDRCAEAADMVKWLPKSGKDRFISMLKTREVWCISRQRAWGTPIALFYSPKTGQVLLEPEIFQATIEYLSKNGINSWWAAGTRNTILGNSYPDYEQIKDIIDVWFESGATHRFVLKQINKYPADMYLEGSDQHRGWFQSSIIEACIDEVSPPYKCVKTHGYTVDNAGRKMSKSLGNGKEPIDIIEAYGVDVLRLWILRQDASKDLTWSNKQMIDVEIMQNKLRNTIKFLITNAREGVASYNDMPFLEKWILHNIYNIQHRANDINEEWNIHTFVSKVYEFCDQKLSTLYFDIRKDALYWEESESPLKLQTQHCMHLILQYLLRWIAPIMPFTAEEAWHAYLERNEIAVNQKNLSIHTQEFLNLDKKWENEKNANEIDFLIEVRKLINDKIEPMRQFTSEIKNNLDAHVEIECAENHFLTQPAVQTLLQSIAIISKLTIIPDETISDPGEGMKFSYSRRGVTHSREGKTYSENVFDKESLNINIKVADGYKCVKCKRRVNQVVNEMCIRCDASFAAKL